MRFRRLQVMARTARPIIRPGELPAAHRADRAAIRAAACFLLAVSLLVPSSACSGTGPNPDPTVTPSPDPRDGAGPAVRSGTVISNDRFSLSYDPETGSFLLEDLAEGIAYSSTPAALEEDPLAKGRYRSTLASTLVIRYTTDFSGAETNAYGSAATTSVACEPIEGGFRATFGFDEVGIRVPVEYRLEETGLSVRVDPAGIVESGRDRLVTLSLLPSFLSGHMDEAGYLFLPDGCGALVRFDAGRNRPGSTYSQPVYGPDPTRMEPSRTEVAEPIRLPVFGVHRNEGGLLAVVEQGASVCTLEASPGGSSSAYGFAYPTFNLRAVDSYTLGAGTAAVTNRLYQEPIADSGILEVRYLPLPKEDSGYVGMAKTYRELLVREKGLAADAPERPLVLELTGAVEVPGSVLGIPVRRILSLTSYPEAEDAIETLVSLGADDLLVRYIKWNQDGIRLRTPFTGSPSRPLGGEDGLLDLLQQAREWDIPLYLDCDPVRFEKTGFLDFRGSVSALLLSRMPAVQKPFLPHILQEDQNGEWGYLSGIRRFQDNMRTIGNRLETLSAGVSTGVLGQVVFGDFRQRNGSRSRVEAAMRASVADLSDRCGPVLADGGNAWILPMAAGILDAPVRSSGFDLESESVPFYQVVLQGLLALATPPLNRDADPHWLFLRAVETGMSPAYSLFIRNPYALKDTRYNGLYGSDFAAWAGEAAQTAATLQALFDGAAPGRILDHRKIAANVYGTDFENGWSVLVNYGSEPFRIGERTVAARDFLAFRTEGA